MKRLILLTALALVGCKDPNDQAKYGDSGLPSNCRAYVQASIDDYRAQKYSADEIMTGLERNCGANGQLWEQK